MSQKDVGVNAGCYLTIPMFFESLLTQVHISFQNSAIIAVQQIMSEFRSEL